MPLFKLECLDKFGEKVVEELDAPDCNAAIDACRQKGLRPLQFAMTEEEKAALAARRIAHDPQWLRKLDAAKGSAFRTLQLVTEAMEEHPELKSLDAMGVVNLSLPRLIEDLRRLTDDARGQISKASVKSS